MHAHFHALVPKKKKKKNSLYWVPLQLGQASGHRPPPASIPGSTLSAGGEKQKAEGQLKRGATTSTSTDKAMKCTLTYW